MLTREKVYREGKTKTILPFQDEHKRVIVESKDDITAHNGLRHDVITGKAILATQTTCNVFALLAECGIPLAYKQQLDEKRFLATYCDMIPYEVIVRREAHGSFIKRNPLFKKGHLFPQLVVEFFLKTTNREWNGAALPKDDPFIVFKENHLELYQPDLPIHTQQPFLTLEEFPLKNKSDIFKSMAQIATQTFLILEKAWHMVGGKLVDFKVEFGFDAHDNLLLADVIDNDSWRVIMHGDYLDKQKYRDGAHVNTVTQLYQRVGNLTNQFQIPRQRIILWRGSEKDAIDSVLHSCKPYESPYFDVVTITRSMHKEPVRALQQLHEILNEVPDSVIIAFIGRSNGAGPSIAANACVPVITVPMGWEKFPDDVWSSLRMPSEVPLLTMLDPQNALLAALQILAMRNPSLYGTLRKHQENRALNFIEISSCSVVKI